LCFLLSQRSLLVSLPVAVVTQELVTAVVAQQRALVVTHEEVTAVQD
jgi:hypothetical protein